MNIKNSLNKALGLSGDDISLMMKHNKEKILKLDSLINQFNLKDITEEDLNGFKTHLQWCHKEILRLYDEYDRIIKATEETEKRIRLYR